MKSHSKQIANWTLWSDSETVLKWIRSDHRRYKSFVAHRIAEVLDSSEVDDWRWVPTKMNPADDATRVKFPPKFDCESRWKTGPNFLKRPSEYWDWPKFPGNKPSQIDDDELRPQYQYACLLAHVSTYALIELTRYSDYRRVRRIMAWVLRFIAKCKKNSTGGALRLAEIEEAEKTLYKMAQRESFSLEYEMLKQNESISRSSDIYQLSPYLDDDKLMRVYGRIDNASAIPECTRRPLLLPRRHALTQLIVDFYHRRFHHVNNETVICELRTKFWIPHVRAAVKAARSQCQHCKIMRAKPATPMMGQLPLDRLQPHVRPFTYTGLDYFGPVYVTVGRRREKRWVALFTCLTIRAIHLELAADLSTDSCLLCIRNFVNRRGVPIRIRSDNGTNFVGADREIKLVTDLFDQDKIADEMSSRGIEWIFNCPGNPSAGGIWERMVQSVKKVLRQAIKEVAPRVETLRSFLIEAENIVNSRPLTHIPIDAEESEPITPNHFLIGGPNSTQTPGPVNERWWCLRKQYRIAQQMKNQFWKRWILEFLPVLTKRTKWFGKVPALQIDDLVLVVDENQPRSQWARGRVSKVFPGKDGQVRVAEIKTTHGKLKRPASRLAVLDVMGKSSEAIYGGGDIVNDPAEIITGVSTGK